MELMLPTRSKTVFTGKEFLVDHILYDANGLRELKFFNILIKASSWEVNLDADFTSG